MFGKPRLESTRNMADKSNHWKCVERFVIQGITRLDWVLSCEQLKVFNDSNA